MSKKSPTPKPGFGFVYALYGSDNPKLARYIGKTTRSMARRMSAHRCWAKSHKSHPTSLWMIGAEQSGMVIGYSVLEETQIENLSEREECWIRFFKPLGSLTNLSLGCGMRGLKGVRSQLNIILTVPKLREANELRKKRVVGDNGKEYESLADAAKGIGCSGRYLRDAIKHGWRARGVRWKLKEREQENVINY